MSKFVIKIIIFLFFFLILDRCFIAFRFNDKNLFADISQKKMQTIKPAFFSDTKFNIIIMGSSHAQFAVSPERVAKEVNEPCLNMAYGGGANLGLQLSLLKYIIHEESQKPKKILFGLDFFALNRSPFYDDKYQRILLNRASKWVNFYESYIFVSYINLYARFIPRYMYDFKDGNWKLPYLRKEQAYDLSMFTKYEKYEISKLGWIQGYGYLDKTFLRYDDEDFQPNADAIKDLMEYVLICKKENIDLIFFQIPEHIVCHRDSKKYDNFNSFMNKFTKEHDLVFLNYNHLQVYPIGDDSLFFDTDHLNINGAKLFTEKLIHDLKLPKQTQVIK